MAAPSRRRRRAPRRSRRRAPRARSARRTRAAGLAVRPPAGAGASDGDDGDDAVRRRRVVDGRRPLCGGAPATARRPGRAGRPLARRVAALGVPPLAGGPRPRAAVGRPRCSAAPTAAPLRSTNGRAIGARTGTPQQPGRCVATLDEHAAAVRRLAVGQDQSFVATASDERRVSRLGAARLLDGDAPPSAARYDGHGGAGGSLLPRTTRGAR